MDARFIAAGLGNDPGFDLVVDGVVRLCHRASDPAAGLAIATADITMVRGNFRFDEERTPVDLPQAITISDHEVTWTDPAGLRAARLQLGTPNGHLAVSFEASHEAINRVWLKLKAGESEQVWGGGEQMSYLRLNGRAFPMWTSEPGVGRDKSTELTRIMDETGMAGGDYWTTNYPQPTFLTSTGIAVHLDSSAYSVLDFTDPAVHQIDVWENRMTLELYAGAGPADLVGQLSARFGRQPRLPDWAISGAIIGLKDGDRSFERLDAIRAAGTVVTGLWCEDWVGVRETSFGRRLFWDWRWNPARYSDLPARIAALKADGIAFLGYVNPYLAVDGVQFAEAEALGFLAREAGSDAPYRVDFGEFDAGVVDFTNHDASAWFASDVIGKQMLDFGLDGWMADFGEYLPVDLRLHDGSDPMLAHNRWPVLWAEVNQQAIASRGRAGDAVFFMRAGFSGVQAHCPLLWAGDQSVDFSRHDGINTVITGALSAGLLGNAYSHSDVGGYTSLHGVMRTADLLKRWAELCAFTPVMRTHEGNRPDHNLQIDSTPDILAHFAAMSRVHAALVPYVHHIMDEAQTLGLPAQRALFLHAPDDPEAWACQDQYFYGPDLLVAPVVTAEAARRAVYLPATGDWVHVWTGESFAPGWHDVAAPSGSPPVFYAPDSRFAALFASLAGVRDDASNRDPG